MSGVRKVRLPVLCWDMVVLFAGQPVCQARRCARDKDAPPDMVSRRDHGQFLNTDVTLQNVIFNPPQ